jgi:hypothetical protein
MVGYRCGGNIPLEPFDEPTALRTALALDRPWPTTVMPPTPSSGAPPYSE